MQKVSLYYNLARAKEDMNRHIHNGWRVHTCSVSCFVESDVQDEKVLVVYEKADPIEKIDPTITPSVQVREIGEDEYT